MIPIYHWNSPEIRGYLRKVCSRGLETPPEVEASVASIIAAVRQGGDQALLELTNEFDGVRLESLRINPVEIRSLAARTDSDLRKIIR
ncbi:MAG: histidinol dehydrogenase, partial [Acidobacteria bacterium]